jgi:Fe-S cluster biogenesis protein NfuA
MAQLKTNPQLVLENGEATAFEIVARTIGYVCAEMSGGINKCHGCPFFSLCNSTSDGFSRADLLRKIAKESKSK